MSGCNRCMERFEIGAEKGEIYFLSDIEELVAKTERFLQKLLLHPGYKQGLLQLEAANCQAFFIENLDAMKSNFSSLEREELKVYIRQGEQTLDFKALLAAKPLQRHINFFDDRDFFDIVNNESLTAHFQPIVEVKNGTIYGYETLARGVRADGRLMYPDQLFAKSKRNDQDFKLDRLCRESALKTAATKKIDQKVFINFIPTSIYDPEFCLKSTEKWAKQLEFDPSGIVFEVVETERVEDKGHLKTILQYYRQKGFQVALDDVGEGYSSLNMLIELQPDIIKIDRKIIDGIDKNEMKRSAYKALYNLAREHGITVLAEGIETPYELEVIKNIGVDLAQGYYFAKPSSEPVRKLALL